MDKKLRELKRKSKDSLKNDLNYANSLMRNNFPGDPGKDFERRYVIGFSYNPKYPNRTMILTLTITLKDGVLKMKFQEVIPTYGYETFSSFWLDQNPNLRESAHDAAVDYLIDEELLDPEEFDIEEAAYNYIDPLYGFSNTYVDDIISTRAPERFFFEDVQEHDSLNNFMEQEGWTLDEVLIDYDLFDYLVQLANSFNNDYVNVYIPGDRPDFRKSLIKAVELMD